ncbi:MAG TPA: permease-like cell division protein FtsX, partial [Candidatus Paceibacterota bacterium]|nr:permease-like cell division protein FtsX [Candidatus Paceibacterota bacterium]
MNWVTIKRIFRAGFLDFWRNAFVSFASILVMTVTLFVVGMTIFAGVMLNFTISELRNKVDVSVYFLTTTPEDRITTLKSALEARPEVTSVAYISRDDALAQFRERYKDDQLALQALEELGENPLEASLQIRAKDISQYEAIA